ncbi:MAG: DUF192 domain-containing protein [Phaeodactylibacter sp.]|nr:DUF192 domain-containing protein [Phaeodactylibacter sp.]MCB9276636.1 DUF192 domain-containing protein [Lewinellaceae bacterium]
MAQRHTPLPNRAQRRQAEQQRRRRLAWLLVALAVPILAGLLFIAMPKTPEAPKGPTFTREGELRFLDGNSGAEIKTIDIEVKQDDYGRREGMMWRRSMEDTQGMLFIMDKPERQSFWMLNTLISLDIIFVDEAFHIINIREKVPPETLDAQSSTGDALYVVEVVGGFCRKFGIKPGDRIQYEVDGR